MKKFVVVESQKYEALLNSALKNKNNEKNENEIGHQVEDIKSGENSSVSDDNDQDVKTPNDSNLLLPEVPVKTNTNRTTSYLKEKKLIKALSEMKQFSIFSNLDELISDSQKQSKKNTLPNEKKFYKLLVKNNLSKLIKNKFKLQKYNPDWFKIK